MLVQDDRVRNLGRCCGCWRWIGGDFWWRCGGNGLGSYEGAMAGGHRLQERRWGRDAAVDGDGHFEGVDGEFGLSSGVIRWSRW